MTAIDHVLGHLVNAGSQRYGQERVSQFAHALQCATLAEQEGGGSSLVAAALLHDIGHLVGSGDEGLAQKGIDARHEVIGVTFLSQWFGDAVTMPVRLHVDAKRYLCYDDPEYFEHLSPASQRSLEIQGGIFTEEKAQEYQSLPYAKEAIALRRWDDLAKDPRTQSPDLTHFRPHLEAHVYGT